jgi:primosomal replication protein N
LLLAATIVQRSVLRYTPAGLPALDLVLAHRSEVSEDGQPRQVQLELKSVGIGSVTQALQSMALDAPAQFAGFLAASRNGRGLVFHINAVDAL